MRQRGEDCDQGGVLGRARIGTVLAVLLLCAVVAGMFWGIRVARYRPRESPAGGSAATRGVARDTGDGHMWRGAVHVHSALSDGAGSVEEIVAAAQDAGLDFLVLTDHNPMGQRPESGWVGDLLLIVSEELSTHDGHIVAADIPSHRYQLGPTKRQAVADAEELGGWAWVAHPHHPAEEFRGGWAGLYGLEVINLAGAWARASWLRTVATGAAYPLNAHNAILRLLEDGLPGLETWDQRTRLRGREEGSWPRPLVALGAVDAHGPALGLAPSYASILGTVQTVIWTRQPPESRRPNADQRILGALREGRAAVVVTSVGAIDDFTFVARAAGGHLAHLGQFAPWEQGPWTLEAGVEASGLYRIKLLRDGEVVSTADSGPLHARAEVPGTYRIEIYRVEENGAEAPVPWVLGNPIYLWPQGPRQAAILHRAPPLPAPPMALSLASEPGWHEENGGEVASLLEASARGPVWHFELPQSPGPPAYAALALRADETWDWSTTRGLVVRLRSKDELRVFVEIRCRDDDGEESSWHYSVKAARGRPAEVIPWSRWRLRWDQASERRALREGRAWVVEAGNALGAAELRRVTGVFLVVTPAILAPGSEATVALETFGLY